MNSLGRFNVMIPSSIDSILVISEIVLSVLIERYLENLEGIEIIIYEPS